MKARKSFVNEARSYTDKLVNKASLMKSKMYLPCINKRCSTDISVNVSVLIDCDANIANNIGFQTFKLPVFVITFYKCVKDIVIKNTKYTIFHLNFKHITC